MDRFRHRSLSLLVGLGLVLAACTTSESPAGSVEPEASASPTSAESAEPSAAQSAAGVPSAAPAMAYACADLISDGEIQAATGLADAAFFGQEHWTDTPGLPEGQTYCQYFADAGGISIAVSILTGPAFEDVYLVFEAAPGGEVLPGIGDAAGWDEEAGAGIARTGGIGITVFITDMSGQGLGGLDLRAAMTALLELIVDRV